MGKGKKTIRQFATFVRKEFRHIFRDVRTMMILLAMPVIQILLFGFAITTEVRNAKVGILSPKHDVMVDRIVQRIDASEYFTVSKTLRSNSEIVPAFQNAEVNLVLAFNEDNSGVQLIADGSEPNQANMIMNYAKGIMAMQMQEMRAGGGMTGITTTTRMLYNPQQKSAYNFVPGVMGLILMLICAMMTSISIVREKEQGTMEVLLASPLPPVVIVIAKLVPYFTLSMVNIATILLLSVFVLGVPISGSLTLLIALCLLFVLLALALGLFVSTVTKTQMAAMLVSGMAMMMPVMVFSGMMFPIESMPRVLQWVSCAVPARWFIEALKKVMLQGCGMEDIMTEVTILAGMAALLLAVSIKNFKVRLQ